MLFWNIWLYYMDTNATTGLRHHRLQYNCCWLFPPLQCEGNLHLCYTRINWFIGLQAVERPGWPSLFSGHTTSLSHSNTLEPPRCSGQTTRAAQTSPSLRPCRQTRTCASLLIKIRTGPCCMINYLIPRSWPQTSMTRCLHVMDRTGIIHHRL